MLQRQNEAKVLAKKQILKQALIEVESITAPKTLLIVSQESFFDVKACG